MKKLLLLSLCLGFIVSASIANTNKYKVDDRAIEDLFSQSVESPAAQFSNFCQTDLNSLNVTAVEKGQLIARGKALGAVLLCWGSSFLNFGDSKSVFALPAQMIYSIPYALKSGSPCSYYGCWY